MAPGGRLKNAVDLVDPLVMAFERLRRLVSGEAKGVHFAAVLFMGPLAAVAILALRELHLVAPSPIWLIPLILVGGQLVTTAPVCGGTGPRAGSGCTSGSHRRRSS